jgi:transcriptional regulator with XRE-family HTH domain
MSLGTNLQKLRKREKISQEEFAMKLDVSRQSVSKWESGDAYPDTAKLIAIGKMFDCSLDVLIKGDIEIGEAVRAKADVAKEGEEIKEKIAKKPAWVYKLGWLIMLTATGIFLLVGYFADEWGKWWIFFPLAAIVAAIIGIFIDNENNDNPE